MVIQFPFTEKSKVVGEILGTELLESSWWVLVSQRVIVPLASTAASSFPSGEYANERYSVLLSVFEYTASCFPESISQMWMYPVSEDVAIWVPCGLIVVAWAYLLRINVWVLSPVEVSHNFISDA